MLFENSTHKFYHYCSEIQVITMKPEEEEEEE
jgi:hypothetical protein